MKTETKKPSNFYVDLHCHPTLKPFGHKMGGANVKSPKSKGCIWHYDPPTLSDKIIDIAAKFSPYSQSNFTACKKGQVFVVGVSLYSPEVPFFKNKLGDSVVATEIENLLTKFGRKRIKQIEIDTYRYFSDLTKQYKYLAMMNGQEVNVNGQNCKYIIIKNYQDIKSAFGTGPGTTIALILNIEGGHCFGPGQFVPEHTSDETEVMAHVDIVKNWKHKPLYVTIAHHFYNELAGHARSIPPGLDKFLDQKYGMNKGITSLGEKVIDRLLDCTDGKRILIDVKHFSRKSRTRYYDILQTTYASQHIPIVFSHGGVNGLADFSKAGSRNINSLFNEWDINLFDDEIIRLVKSDGFFGLNMDQRVIASKKAQKKAGGKLSRHKMLFSWSKLIWNNIEHIAKVLSKADLPAWDHICMGTDYDGAINPINGYWTEEEMTTFEDYMNMHCHNYMKKAKLHSYNKLLSDEIVSKVMKTNAMDFIKRNY